MTPRRKAPKAPKSRLFPKGKVVLYTLLEDEQGRALRVMAFKRQTGIAELVREAIDEYLETRGPSPKEIEKFVELVRRSVRAQFPPDAKGRKSLG